MNSRRNPIYYLYNLHKSYYCISTSGAKYIEKYVNIKILL